MSRVSEVFDGRQVACDVEIVPEANLAHLLDDHIRRVDGGLEVHLNVLRDDVRKADGVVDDDLLVHVDLRPRWRLGDVEGRVSIDVGWNLRLTQINYTYKENLIFN